MNPTVLLSVSPRRFGRRHPRVNILALPQKLAASFQGLAVTDRYMSITRVQRSRLRPARGLFASHHAMLPLGLVWPWPEAKLGGAR